MKKNSDNTSTNLDKYNQIYYLNMAGQATGDILNYLSNVVRFCPNEVGYTLNYYPNGVDYNYQISKIQSGTPTSVSLSFYQSTISSIHIHPFDVNSGPSAGDALTLISTNQTFSPNYTTSFVMAYDGSQYALVIEDSDLAEIFFDTYSEGSDAIFDANGDWTTNPNYQNDGGYPMGSDLFSSYESSKKKLTDEGMSANDAHDYAMALTLQQAGVVLLKKDAGSTDFHQLSTTETNTLPNGEGEIIYVTSKCNE